MLLTDGHANAGITKDNLLMRMSDEDIDAVVQTNLSGSIRLCRGVARGMIRAKTGRIVLISSVVGLLGSAGQVNYAASKAGLVGAARSLARELGSRGITVNVVAPGFVETDMTAELDEGRRDEHGVTEDVRRAGLVPRHEGRGTVGHTEVTVGEGGPGEIGR